MDSSVRSSFVRPPVIELHGHWAGSPACRQVPIIIQMHQTGLHLITPHLGFGGKIDAHAVWRSDRYQIFLATLPRRSRLPVKYFYFASPNIFIGSPTWHLISCRIDFLSLFFSLHTDHVLNMVWSDIDGTNLLLSTEQYQWLTVSLAVLGSQGNKCFCSEKLEILQQQPGEER